MLFCGLLYGGDCGLRRASKFSAEFRSVYAAGVNGLIARL